MRARHWIVFIAAFVLFVQPPAAVDAAKNNKSPGQRGSKNKKNNNKKKSGGGSSVAKVSNNLRQKFGGIAAGKLPAALISYQTAKSKVKDAELALTRLMRDIEIDKQENRREIARRVQLARETYVNSERYYGETMVRIRNRLKRDSQYRNTKSELSRARDRYDQHKAENGGSTDAILALGEIVELESQLEEMEYDAMGTDQDALQAKSNYEDAKRDYNAARRELLDADHGSDFNRSAVKQAYQAVEDARRQAAAKGRIVQQYKYLIKTATFQRTVLGAGGSKTSGGKNKARKAKKGKRR